MTDEPSNLAATEPTAIPDRAVQRLRTEIECDPITGCHIWTGAKSAGGYGMLRDGKRVADAHRLSYELACGPIPAGAVLRHGPCDRPSCINADHLRPGSQKENMQDAVERGRIRRGKGSRRPNLTGRERVEIHGMRLLGFRKAEIASVYGVHLGTVQMTLNGHSGAVALDAELDTARDSARYVPGQIEWRPEDEADAAPPAETL